MKSIFTLVLLLVSAFSVAGTATVVGVSRGEKTFLKLSNGEVKFVSGFEKHFIGQIIPTEVPETSHSLAETSYIPSLLEGTAGVHRMYNSFREGAKRKSECYNRAHVWAYEESKYTGTKLQKTFVFFTDSFIRRFNYKWWFHVAPSADVVENGVTKHMVIDPTFLDSSLELKEWTDFFVETHRACPVVKKYSDYDKNQETQDCYVMITPMYFWQPLDIENFEKTGVEKTTFEYDDLWIAYKQGFGKRF